MQVENDDDIHEGQRSNGVKFSRLCSMATNVVIRSLMTITTCIKVKGQQRSNMIIYVIWPPHLIRCTATS